MSVTRLWLSKNLLLSFSCVDVLTEIDSFSLFSFRYWFLNWFFLFVQPTTIYISKLAYAPFRVLIWILCHVRSTGYSIVDHDALLKDQGSSYDLFNRIMILDQTCDWNFSPTPSLLLVYFPRSYFDIIRSRNKLILNLYISREKTGTLRIGCGVAFYQKRWAPPVSPARFPWKRMTMTDKDQIRFGLSDTLVTEFRAWSFPTLIPLGFST